VRLSLLAELAGWAGWAGWLSWLASPPAPRAIAPSGLVRKPSVSDAANPAAAETGCLLTSGAIAGRSV